MAPRVSRLLLALAALALASPAAHASILPSCAQPDATAPADPAYESVVEATNAVVAVRVNALGSVRTGSGVVIEKGLVLTIGYLILEADTVDVIDSRGVIVSATVVAYDQASGFGLLRPVARLAVKPIRIGNSAPVTQLDRLMIVSGASDEPISVATVVSRRQLARYLIDGAIVTSSRRLDHSGAALINSLGELVGIGSRNLFVPVDLLKEFMRRRPGV